MKAKTIDAVLMVGLFIFLIFATSYIGPSLDDNGPEHEVAREELAKQQRYARFEKAAREICGNSDWRLTDGKNEIVCLIRHSKKTRVASL